MECRTASGSCDQCDSDHLLVPPSVRWWLGLALLWLEDGMGTLTLNMTSHTSTNIQSSSTQIYSSTWESDLPCSSSLI
jgi:hypothetical protein